MDITLKTAIITGIVAIVTASITNLLAPIVKAKIDSKAKKEERADKKEDEQSEWQKHIDRKIASIEKELTNNKDMTILSLRGSMLITQHLVDGNHTQKMKEYYEEMEEFLMNKIS